MALFLRKYDNNYDCNDFIGAQRQQLSEFPRDRVMQM